MRKKKWVHQKKKLFNTIRVWNDYLNSVLVGATSLNRISFKRLVSYIVI